MKDIKMSDVFILPIKLEQDIDYDASGSVIVTYYLDIEDGYHAYAAAHAINSHDALVKENEELKELVENYRLYGK